MTATLPAFDPRPGETFDQAVSRMARTPEWKAAVRSLERDRMALCHRRGCEFRLRIHLPPIFPGPQAQAEFDAAYDALEAEMDRADAA